MSPTAALLSPIFSKYLGIVLGLLSGAGLVLGILQFGFRKKLGTVWRTYVSWLWMAPLAAFVIFAGRAVFIAAVTLLALLGLREFVRAARWKGRWWFTGIIGIGLIGVGLLALLRANLAVFLLVATAVIVLAGVVAGEGVPGRSVSGDCVKSAPGFQQPGDIVPGYNGRDNGRDAFRRMSLGAVAFILLGGMFGQLSFLADAPHACGYLCFLLLATELNDVAAFIFGKIFGRHLLLPRISPRKTWEGSLGALVLSLLLPWLLRFSFPHFSATELIISGLIVGVGGQLGDLTFSALKRDFGVKDWGAAILGHGGVLDRIDSLIFVAPLFMFMARYYHPGG